MKKKKPKVPHNFLDISLKERVKFHINMKLFALYECLCPNVGVPEDGRDLTVEAATEGQPGGHQPQAE